jgi:glycosyltransferase involved in cell wall biosynthesis
MNNNRKPKSRLQKKQETVERLRKTLATKQGPKKICLVMIVRNESKNMPRLLPSVKPIVDMISIVDTGSTDNTVEVILTWGKENNMPTIVHHEPFKNFSHNRTHSFNAAKQAFPEADYFLLSDADFVWKIDEKLKFDKTLLIDHKYLIEQYNNNMTYWNIRLLSAKVKFESAGVTHEYWVEHKDQTEYCGEVRTAKIKNLKILDLEDGGSKSDKFTRDERLLKEGLADPESNQFMRTRYKFYLAQTLKDMGKYEESIEWYTKRVEDKGWPEEVYYAKFQIGFDYEQLGWKKKQAVEIMGKSEKSESDIEHLKRWNPNNLLPVDLMRESVKSFTDAGVNYLAAYNYRKFRVEALYYVTRMYRLLGMNDMSYKFAVIGNKIPFPKEDTLFVEQNCYDYLFDFEISIVAGHLPDYRDEGRQAISRLMKRDDLPEWIKNVVDSNSRFYI